MCSHTFSRLRIAVPSAQSFFARLGLLLLGWALVGITAAHAELNLSPSSVEIAVGASAQVRVSGASGNVTVSSASATIASASFANGVVTISGKQAGKTTVSVADPRSRRQVEVTVRSVSTSLSVSPTSVSIVAGTTAQIQASGVSGTLRAVSANTAIVTASVSSQTITLRGVRAGSATVSISDSRSTRSVAVSVTASVPTLSVTPTSVSIAINASAQVQVSGSSGTVRVTSANPLIATARLAGNFVSVTGVTAGSTTVTVADRSASRTVSVTVTSATSGGTGGVYALLAWNDLGMHCVDGSDYSVFSLLPPYNNLHAQLVNKSSGGLTTAGVTLSYESVADAAGSINTISSTKTNFWQYVKSLFGAQPAPNVGLAGNPTPSMTPAPLRYNAAQGWFEAEGIPITPIDDLGRKNFYPMVKVVAKDSAGRVLASTSNVLPVSDEMTCKGCHSSVSSGNAAQLAAKPQAGWVFDPAPERDWKRNVLRLHDQKHLGNAAYAAAISKMQYNAQGLSATVDGGRPILCAACHSSNALPGTGVTGISALTAALHTKHAAVIDPVKGVALDAVGNRAACYQCHPGSVTKCLRGAMSNVVDAGGNEAISCQSCHGKMTDVGKTGRVGWLQQPNCQACHHDGVRDTAAVDSSGVLRAVTDGRFATNANTPAAGFSLFRFSKGHGGLQCEACHGSTHAEYPSVDPNDNVQSIALQGYAGTVTECKSCHATVPNTTAGGPHGMHTIGDAWVSRHGDVAEGSGRQACTYCHGSDFRGSPLSEIKVAKTFRVEDRTKTFAAGHKMNCYDCHNGPGGD